MPEKKDKIRIAVVQVSGAALEAWRATLESVLLLATRAAEHADLVLLPECAWPAYWLGSFERYRAARADGMPGPDEFIDRLSDLARERRVHVCAGYVAEEDHELFNRAVLIDRAGEILGTHDKCFLWGFDRKWFHPGREIRPIDTEFGPVGVMVCADARLPEIAATLAARGARLLLQPTAWVNSGTADRPWNPQPDFLIPARARELGVPVASAGKCGMEGETLFVGSSLICDARGRRLARCEQHGERMAVAEVELPAGPRRRRIPRRWRMRADFTTPPHLDQLVRLTIARVGPMRGDAQVHADVGALSCSVAFGGLHNSDGAHAGLHASAPAAEPTHVIELYGPTESVVGCGQLRLASISGFQAHHFAPARALALQGVHLLVVFGRARNDSLRARAAENRIFVVTVEDRPRAFDPRGLPVSSEGGANGALLTLAFNPGQAVSKEVAPETDVFAGRRMDLYQF